MKKNIIPISLMTLCICFCGFIIYMHNAVYVEQEYTEMNDGEDVIATYVWHGTDLIWARYDNLETINDSIMKSAQDRADSLVKILKNLK